MFFSYIYRYNISVYNGIELLIRNVWKHLACLYLSMLRCSQTLLLVALGGVCYYAIFKRIRLQ